MPTDETMPSRQTLDRVPARALTFLLGVGRSAVIRGVLESKGYTNAEHERGWSLLRAVDPSVAPVEPGEGALPQSDPAVREALANLDAWDNENLPIADVALRRREPAARAFLFAGGLAPSDGIASVRAVASFVERLDALDDVADPKPAAKSKAPARDDAAKPAVTKAQAKRALEILASRGIDEAARGSVQAWLATVQKGAAPAKPAPAVVAPVDVDAALRELYDWVDEWTLVARKVIKRRDHLVALGMATRKARAPKPAAPAKPA